MVVASCIISSYSDFYLLFSVFHHLWNKFHIKFLLFEQPTVASVYLMRPNWYPSPTLDSDPWIPDTACKSRKDPKGWMALQEFDEPPRTSDVHVLSLCPQSQDQIHSWKIKRSSRSFTPKHTHWDENHYSIIKDHLLRQYTPLFLPGKSHGQRSLVGYSPWGCKQTCLSNWAHAHAGKYIFLLLSSWDNQISHIWYSCLFLKK